MTRRSLILATLLLAACGSTPMTPPTPRLLPFDTTSYSHKPADTGMDSSMLMIGNFMAGIPRLETMGVIDGAFTNAELLAEIARRAAAAKYQCLVMDDEEGDNLRIRRNIAVIRRAAPSLKIGVFCFPQVYFNWTPEHTRSVNDSADVKAILNASDFSVPGTDLRWDMATPEGRKSWLSLLKAGVAESRRTMPGKPCYPFLPLAYNEICKVGDLSAAEMAWQLQQVKALGLQPIIWGGWTRTWGEYPWRQGVKAVYP